MVMIDAAPNKVELDIARPDFLALTPENLRRIGELRGGLGATVASFAKLAMGPGKISFADYIRLRLFDPAMGSAADLRNYVGLRRNLEMCTLANYRRDWHGMASNKVASLHYLAAYGFPTIPIKAIYAPGMARRQAAILSDRPDLVRFLSAPENYPLFGKPAEGFQSLGSIGLKSVSGADGALLKTNDETTSVDKLADEIVANYRSGYIFQALARPHQDIVNLCGPHLATVRLITGLTEDGPTVLRGCWKIPAGGNAADNYWRAGNLLAGLDLGTGEILRASSGAGLSHQQHETHPDTGVRLVGFRHPEWSRMLELAREGASLMRHMPLIGWDMAYTEQGPVIVEMNEAPDFSLVQIADRRGIHDETFDRFMAYQAKNAKNYVEDAKKKLAKL
ncbi:sugar-transfer associated ATP-grasp domain-containing protein [Rhodoblastus sp.]|uniref:sugar-transfer associated ATP-grasp domain-containing protein n=1 Tax=Rhodoblastus sp. TaxID=1962975 RepID=UPI0026099BDB|nr:sugar-transfer associated ATP-grasp domain-containing protein [Rhodoblastus sp.]